MKYFKGQFDIDYSNCTQNLTRMKKYITRNIKYINKQKACIQGYSDLSTSIK